MNTEAPILKTYFWLLLHVYMHIKFVDDSPCESLYVYMHMYMYVPINQNCICAVVASVFQIALFAG